MTSHDEEGQGEETEGQTSHGADGDDATLPAGSDVVAQIRAHAAKVRSGEISADEFAVGQNLDVWTAEPGHLLPHDETVAFTTTLPPATATIASSPAPARTPVRQPVPASSGGSLIDGQATPDVSTSFWNTDQPFRASGIDAPTRSRRGGIPLGAWVAVVIVLIVVASVGIAVAVAAMGPMT